MSREDCEGMIASSIAAVMRQSLHAQFRKECLLLLGVPNNTEAQDAIYSLLKSRKTSGASIPVTEESSQSSKDADEPSSPFVREECPPEEPSSPCLQIEFKLQPDSDGVSRERDWQLSIKTEHAQSPHPKPSQTEDSSDDETQLDWDSETEGKK